MNELVTQTTPVHMSSTTDVNSDKTSYILFELANKNIALELTHVREILEYETLCPIPTTNELSAGVINLRGQVVAVLNLHHRFNLPQLSLSKNTCILIVDVKYADQSTSIGLLIDKVSKIIDMPASSKSNVPEIGTSLPTHFIDAMLNYEESFVPIINLNTVCSLAQLANLVIGQPN